ncbi:23916_t:CDS:1, partial [Gigaspora margarita]
MLDKSEKLKHLEAVRKLVVKKAAKNYLPLSLQDYAARMLDLGSSVKELKYAKITNIKYK